MKHIKFLLIIMLILNLIISIILGIESKHIREELVNIKLAEEVEDFSKRQKTLHILLMEMLLILNMEEI